MNNFWDLFSLHLGGVLLTLTALGFGISAIMPNIARWNKTFFMSLFAINILLVAVALVALFAWEIPKMAAAEKISALPSFYG